MKFLLPITLGLIAVSQLALSQTRENFTLDGVSAFVITPDTPATGHPWIAYAPSVGGLPGGGEAWMFARYYTAGIAVAGIYSGDLSGSPAQRAGYTNLYNELVLNRGYAPRFSFHTRSRGGLLGYNWTADNPDKVAAIGGIYPVTNLLSYPGASGAASHYGISVTELTTNDHLYNPIERLAPLAANGVKMFHIHGDSDTLVPLSQNSQITKDRYDTLGGTMTLKVIVGGGHDGNNHWWTDQDLTDFMIAETLAAVTTEGPPTLNTLAAVTPADDATNVTVSDNLSATFSEFISLTGAGSITLRNFSGGADIPVTLPGDISISGAVLTIDPATDLVGGDEYAVEISNDAIEDLDDTPNAFAGLLPTDTPNWNFTADNTAPGITTLDPVNAATGFPSNGDLVLGFDEDVQVGTGNITVHLAGDDSMVESINVTTGAVVINGAGVTVDISNLADETGYYVQIAAGAFADLSGNPFTGISGNATWAFTTGVPVPTPAITQVNSPGGGAMEEVYIPDVSDSDLLHGLVGVESGTAWLAASSRLNNGTHGPSFDNDQGSALAEIAWADPGSTVTFTLGTGSNGLGYDIASIQSIAAWQSAGFGNQGYTIEVQPVGGTFTALVTIEYAPLAGAGATKVTINDDGSGPGGNLATGIEAIRFTHNATPGATNGRVTYRELDVFGTDTVGGTDSTPPSINSLDPGDNSTGVSVSSNLAATFSEPIVAGSGAITLKNLDAPSQTVIPVDDARVSVNGAVLTIDPEPDLDTSANYALRIDAGAIEDVAGNSFAGIADDSTWNFFTAAAPDTTAPTVSSLTPADDADDVATTTDLVLGFDEDIQPGTGNIMVHRTSDDSVVETINAGSGSVTTTSSTATIDIADLASGTGFYVMVPPDAFEDLAGNAFAGILDATSWSFSTEAPAPGPVFDEAHSAGGPTTPGGAGELMYDPDVSSSDLLDGIAGVESGSWGAPASRLNDGTHGGSFDQGAGTSGIAWPTVGASVTFTLGTGANGLGYDISSIQSIAAWQSAGFGNQGFTIEVQPVGGSFGNLASVLYTPLGSGDAGATKVTITGAGGGLLATGIEAIRFTQDNLGAASAGGRSTYRELDVFGTDTAPDITELAITAIAVTGNTVTLQVTGNNGVGYWCASSPDLSGFSTTETVYEIGTSTVLPSPFQTTSGSLTFDVDVAGRAAPLFFRVQDEDPSR